MIKYFNPYSVFDCIYFQDDCPSKPAVKESARPDLNINLVWNEANIGELTKVSCPCGIEVSSGADRDFTDRTKWSNATIESCNITDFVREICHLTKVFLI